MVIISTTVFLFSGSLRAGRSGDRMPVEARFSAFVQAVPRAHLATYTMGTGSSPGIKRPGRGVDHPPHLALKLKKECGHNCISRLGLRSLSLGELCLLRFYDVFVILR